MIVLSPQLSFHPSSPDVICLTLVVALPNKIEILTLFQAGNTACTCSSTEQTLFCSLKQFKQILPFPFFDILQVLSDVLLDHSRPTLEAFNKID